MTPTENTILDEILAECDRVLELDAKARKGPWKSVKNHPPYKLVWISKKDNYSTLELEAQDADFIAASRTLTPFLARALKVAIPALRASEEQYRLLCKQWKQESNEDYFISSALRAIIAQWRL